METRIAPKYRLEVAIRPFSYSVALGACALGGMWALRAGHGSPWLLLVIVLAGVLLQMGVNLVNNRADLDVENLELSALEREAIARQFKIGLACFAGALAIALLLVAMRGWPLAVLLIVGFLGAWFYTAEPIHYKRRGLGVPLVFLFMGVLMICGAAIAMGAPVNFHLVELVLLSLPISLLTALLLLANELRDYERDIRDRLGTLSVRIGLHRATRLFMAMLAAAYLLTVLWWGMNMLHVIWPIALSLPLVIHPVYAALSTDETVRAQLPPRVGRLLMGFSLLYLLCYSADMLFLTSEAR